jgi:hypothetical protein
MRARPTSAPRARNVKGWPGGTVDAQQCDCFNSGLLGTADCLGQRNCLGQRTARTEILLGHRRCGKKINSAGGARHRIVVRHTGRNPATISPPSCPAPKATQVEWRWRVEGLVPPEASDVSHPSAVTQWRISTGVSSSPETQAAMAMVGECGRGSLHRAI